MPEESSKEVAANVAESWPSHLASVHRFYRTIFANSYEGVTILDRKGIIKSISPSSDLTLGLPLDELIGREGLAHCHPDDLLKANTAFQAALSRPGEVVTVELRFLQANGEWCEVESRVVNLLDDELVAGVVINFRDVTEWKRVTRSLQESETMLLTVFEHVPAFIVLVSCDGRVLFVNKTVPGMTFADVLGKDICEFSPPSTHSMVREKLSLAIESGTAQEYEVEGVGPNGSRTFYYVRLAPIIQDSKVTSLVYVCSDQTAQRQAKEELRERELQLAHVSRLRSLGEMVAGLAHEMNQPLHAISNFAAACERSLSDTVPLDQEELRRNVQGIRNAIQRAAEIIKRQTTFAKRDEFPHANISVNSLIQNATQLAAPILRMHGTSLQWTPLETDILLHVDTIQIEQVLLNLITNSIESMQQLPREQRVVNLHAQLSAGTLIISVHDCGEGLTPDTQERLFEPFFTTKQHGLGLGLAICQTIAETHGGFVDAAPRPGGGAIFRIHLPVSK